MTTPEQGQPEEPTQPLPPQGPPPGAVPPPPPGGYAPPPAGGYPPQPGWAPQPGSYPYGPYGANPQAPYGYHQVTGQPFSEKSKIVAGLLQIFLPFGIGRFYMGQTNMGIAQLLVAIFTCGIGSIWSFVDGILVLINGGVDEHGRPLREGV
ncbi:MAG: TM2 domain-containing protein [Aeromicrobium sp.]